ncbi:MAG: FecR domain-containing protein [Sideroxydans sp.]|nr:FecR domain-containing protein [Sideroxydans sp.]
MIKNILLSLILLFVTTAAYAEASGKIGYMSGALVAHRPDGTIKVLAPKADVSAGDLLVTAKDSYAQVVMNDGTKMTMRPNSNLKIETYSFRSDAPQADSAVFRLLKGGFRTVTGLIGKRGNKDAYKLHAATATLGIRGTDFTARLCAAADCSAEAESKLTKTKSLQVKAVGRVMLIEGELAAKGIDAKLRRLTLGSPVYEGDTLQSSLKSHAVVVFRDGGRITLQESSVFHIEAFKYDKVANQENIALRLLKGGVRVVTGLIGRVNHDNYKFRVSAATIGIRGTGFDAWCNGPCAEGAENFGATAGNPLDGAGVFVWAGEVVLVSPGGAFTVAINQAAIIARETGKPVLVLAVPASILENTAPKPDSVPVDIDKLFEEGHADGEPGFYVSVNEGQVILTKGDEKIDLGKGESGFSNEQLLTRLGATPSFMGGDAKLESIEGAKKSGISGGGCVVVP